MGLSRRAITPLALIAYATAIIILCLTYQQDVIKPFQGGIGIGIVDYYNFFTNPTQSQFPLESDTMSLGDYGGQDGYCTAGDIVEGTWHTFGLLKSVPEMVARYGLGGWHHYNCRDLKGIHQESRALAVASPELVPARECRVRNTDWRNTIKRLLRMPMGMVFIGDSLTQQHADSIDSLLRIHKGPVLVNWKQEIHRWLYLDPTHPETLTLIKEAGVPFERVNLPLFTYFRTTLMIDESEGDEIFEGVEEYKYKSATHIDWYTALNELWNRAKGLRQYREGVLEEPSVVLLEQGPHWTGQELGFRLKDEELLKGWYKMVDMIEDKIRNTKIPMSLYWRTVAPGQNNCTTTTSVDNTRYNSTDYEHPRSKSHNHHLFSSMIDRLRSKFNHNRSIGSFNFLQNQKSHEAPNFINPPLRLFDVWDMSVKRPDARLFPGPDCLHWCMVGVTDYWHQLLWHMVLEESRNSDYENPNIL